MVVPKSIQYLQSISPRLSRDGPTIQWRPKRLGFTLIEVVVVISILGILASAGVGSFNKALDKGHDRARKEDLNSIKTALITFFQDNGEYPPVCSTPPCQALSLSSKSQADWIPGLTPDYIPKLPKDPKQAASLGRTFAQIFSFFTKPTQPSSVTLGQTSQLATHTFGSYIGTGTLGFEEDPDPAKFNLSYSAGYILRQQWAKIEPQDDVYNWSYLDSALAKLKAAGKKGSIRIVVGPNSPDWLRTQYNIKTICWFQTNDNIWLCFPWMTDAKYQAERKEMLSALYNHYKNDRSDLETAISFVSLPVPKHAESAEAANVRNPNWTVYVDRNDNTGIPIGIYCSTCQDVASQLPSSTFANQGYSDASLYQQLQASIIDAYSAMPTWYIAILHGKKSISPLLLVQNSYDATLNNNLQDRVMMGFTWLARYSALDAEQQAIYNDVKTNFYQGSGGNGKVGWQVDGSTQTDQLYEAWCELAAPMSSKWLEASGPRWPSSDLDQIFQTPDCGILPPSPGVSPSPVTSPAPSPAPSPSSSPIASPPPTTGCTNDKNVYCYIVSADRLSFVLWTQLEDKNDNQIIGKPDSPCTVSPPPVPPFSSFNYCLINPN